MQTAIRRIARAAVLGVVAATTVAAQARGPRTMLIRNGTVITVTKGTLQNTDVLLENGRIARIGQNLTAPAGAEVYDASGKFVMPGIIDPHSHMMTDATNEGAQRSEPPYRDRRRRK